MRSASLVRLFFLFTLFLSACNDQTAPIGAVPERAETTAVVTEPSSATEAPATVTLAALPKETVTVEATEASREEQEADQQSTEADSTVTLYDELPPPLATAAANAQPTHGEQLAVTAGCTACHSLEEGVKLVGPSWYNIGQLAAERVPSESAALYLYHSIIEPNQYVVEEYLPGLMPQTYQSQLSDQDLADLIAYLLSLQAAP